MSDGREPFLSDDGIDWDREAEVQVQDAGRGRDGPACDYFRSYVKPGSRVLDLGCNIAQMRYVFREMEPDAVYEGLDASPTAIELARKRHPGATFHLMDARQMQFVSRFDFIYTHAVLQHNDRESKGEIATRIEKALVPGGIVVVEEATEGSAVDGGTGMSIDGYLALFRGAGLDLVKTQEIGGGGTGFVFRKPNGD